MEGLKGPDHTGIAIIFPQEYQRQQWKLNIAFLIQLTVYLSAATGKQLQWNWEMQPEKALALRAPRTQDK